MAVFIIHRAARGEGYQFTLESSQGEALLMSEVYEDFETCWHDVEPIRIYAPLESRYERINRIHEYTFWLKSANQKLIARSARKYASAASRDQAIERAKWEAPLANVRIEN
ncbi:hypothetical protein BWI93_13755 [Siphonobacter sp. BAB-5385]|uniref:DUF1508 domain-containing protein n=1 Tax=unclassified Siphonobacter TaxID=2635712 RepID=UPI000B9E3058|nr:MULTISPECIES: DUF1508 domain-containing protein [unclassified Siphonobacter]OZI07615.1 hypothetical protein BWI93_13755 [Siphonobacter sp. BAB-5385]PMD91471.1 hypothetical protein BWI97_21865 [Siphonobacter sp. BAB-5405]